MKQVLPIILLGMFLSFCSCMGKHSSKLAFGVGSHEIEVREKGIGMIYLDRVPNSKVMRENSNTKGTKFYSYLVGFQDSSLITDNKKKLERERYFQYDMYRDWVMLMNGDSLRPVFFQPLPQKIQQAEEGILVFEIPYNKVSDTLIYTDSYGSWGQHQIYLNR
jgi:hypothetical protein